MALPPPGEDRPRRIRSGRVRRGGSRSGIPGHPAPTGTAGLGPAERRRLRRDMLAGRHRGLPPRRRRPGLRVALLLLALLCTAGFGASATVYVGYNVYLAQVPDATTVAQMDPPLDTNVYASNGTLIDIIHPPGHYHLDTTYDGISPYMREATVDIEDHNYWTESSVDIPRIVEAGWGYIRHKYAGGASTIPEQLAKITFLHDNGSLSYKVKEIILGNEISQEFSKQQILEMYLNRIPYGEQTTGVETAAEVYFHETAAQLDLAQAAMLAGLPQAPTAYNPVLHAANQTINPAAKARQRQVLNAMVKYGSITQAQADAAYREPLKVYGYQQYDPYYYMHGSLPVSFLDYLVHYYLPQTFGDTFQDPGGWDIYTTVNLKDQALADQTVSGVVNSHPQWFLQKGGGDGALVSMDPQNGEILAMTGSANYNSPIFGQLNMAIETRQPGSTMKLFTYSALLATRQYTMTTPISNNLFTINGYTPKNYEGTAGGYCLMEYCLGNSINIAAVRAEYAAGVMPIANLAVAAGLNLYNGGQPAFATPTLYSFTLGTLQVSPLDLADAASMIADLGIAHAPAPVTTIRDATDGRVVYQYNPQAAARRVLPENVAFVMDQTLSVDAFRQPDFGRNDKLTLPGRQASAKTGTSGAGFTNYDNWTVGWTPNLLTSVWVGDPRGEGGKYSLTPGVTSGLTGAAPIWQAYMEGVTQGTPATWYTPPSDVYQAGGTWYLAGTGPDSSAGEGPAICQPGCGYSGTAVGSAQGGFASNPEPPTPAPAPAPSPTPAGVPVPSPVGGPGTPGRGPGH